MSSCGAASTPAPVASTTCDPSPAAAPPKRSAGTGSVSFSDVTESVGLGGIRSASASVGDFNRDGRADFLVAGPGDPDDFGDDEVRVYGGCGGRYVPVFTQIVEGVSALLPGGRASTVHDLDGDGHLDFIVAFPRSLVAWYGSGDFRFESVGLWQHDVESLNTVASLSPFYLDGVQHLYVAVEGEPTADRQPEAADVILRREGQGRTYVDVTETYPVLRAAGEFSTLAFGVVSRVGQGLPSLVFIGNDGAEDALIALGSNGAMTPLTLPPFNPRTATMGVDYRYDDRTGEVDLVISDIARIPLLHVAPSGVTDASERLTLLGKIVTWGLAFADLDNDGDEDLAVAAGFSENLGEGTERKDLLRTGKLLYFEDDGTGRLTDRSAHAGPLFTSDAANYYSLVTTDFDRDGCIDLLVTPLEKLVGNRVETDTSVRLLRNDCATGNAFLGFEVPDDLGAQVRLRVTTRSGAQRTRYREVKAATGLASRGEATLLHFGLGDVATVDAAAVLWSDGTEQSLPVGAPGGYTRVSRAKTTGGRAVRSPR